MPYLEIDNCQVFYNVEGSGEPLLLLHGNSVSSSLFKFWIPFLSKKYKVIYFDYPGHGKSGRLDTFRDDFWFYNASVALKILNFLEIDNLKVIGTSGGALVGLNMCIQNPKIISHLIADSFFGDSIDKNEIYRIVEFRRNAIKNDYMLQQYWKAHNGENWENVILNDIEFMKALADKNLPLIWGDVGTIESKVHLVASSGDELINDIINRTKVLADKIPSSSYSFFDSGRHTFMITQKEIFKSVIEDFFEIKF